MNKNNDNNNTNNNLNVINKRKQLLFPDEQVAATMLLNVHKYSYSKSHNHHQIEQGVAL